MLLGLLVGCESPQLGEVDLALRTKDLGKLAVDEKATHSFRIVNTTSSQLTIESIRKNCGCTETDLSDGVKVKKGGELLVKIGITGRASGGREVGELFINTNSDCPNLRSIRLSLAAEFPKAIWTEPSELFVSKGTVSSLRLYSSLPDLVPRFLKVEVKPDVFEFKLSRQTSSFLDFEIDRDPSAPDMDWIYAFAVLQFEDQRMPFHTVMVRNQDRIKAGNPEGGLK